MRRSYGASYSRTQEDTMTRRLKTALIAAAGLAAIGAGGAGIAVATGGDDGRDKPIGDSALDRASRVALDRTGGGRVSGTEVGDEEGYYEVEVTRGDGSKVDVHLDRDFKVLDAKPDEEG
jgi:uncharacterized membrane protein YkoI